MCYQGNWLKINIQEEVSRLQNDLAATKREQTIEVTKLLEYISQLEREKLEAETSKLSFETNQATVNSLKTENQELAKKKVAVENAFQQLKMKHMKLVQMHADHLRTPLNVRELLFLDLLIKFLAHESNKKRINSHLHGMFEFLRLQIMKEIQSEKALLGTRSAQDRGKGLIPSFPLHSSPFKNTHSNLNQSSSSPRRLFII